MSTRNDHNPETTTDNRPEVEIFTEAEHVALADYLNREPLCETQHLLTIDWAAADELWGPRPKPDRERLGASTVDPEEVK